FSFYATVTSALYTTSLHDALPILLSSIPRCFRSFKSAAIGWSVISQFFLRFLFRFPWSSQLECTSNTNRTPLSTRRRASKQFVRSEEHTSELQPLTNLVFPLLLEK